MQWLAENLERQLAAQVRKGLVVWLDKCGLYMDQERTGLAPLTH